MNPMIDRAFDPETFRQSGHELVDRLADYLADVRRGEGPNVFPAKQPADAAADWELPTEPADTAHLFAKVLEDSIHLHHPHYVGHQISVPAPLASLSGLLADFVNNGMGVYEMGMAGTAMERAVIRTVARQMNFDDRADGFMTSGGTLANLTALLAARSAQVSRDIWTQGDSGQLAVMVSEQAHYCIGRAVRIMGWGDAGVVKIPVDQNYRMCVDQLDRALEQATEMGKQVVAVVGSACSTATGSFDDLEAIGRWCQQQALWFHVDGAHGAAVAFSRKYRHLVNGIQHADSVVLDFHKMLMTPVIASMLLFKDGENGYRTFDQQAHYLWSRGEDKEWFNLAKRTFECTKSMMSLKVYTLLHTYGLDLWDANVTRLNDLAALFAERILARPAFELAVQPQTNIVCFRYRDTGWDDATIDRANAAIRQRLLDQGEFYIVQTTLRDRLWLRVTVANPLTTEKDLQQLLDTIEQWAPELAASH